ncbi:MAG: 1-acyl-sn-glycerol-3-phosphate acyltransferase [Oscillospiraceae bacterium]|nr:1-acyl-sn-glycerol-3-phosphate acyltransferase [Oscillospiraceae bacterium]
MIEGYFLVSIPAAAATAALADAWWWLLPLFLGYFAGLMVLHVLLTGVFALVFGGEGAEDKERPWLQWWLWQTARLVLKVLGARVHLTGEEKIPTDSRFVLVCNHLSFFDPVTGVASFYKHRIVYISKKENFTMPIVGRIMRACRHISLDRENPRNAIKTINKAADLIDSGEHSIAIFPEGTRSRKIHMLPFKAGAFHIAKKSKVPVVVMTMTGTEMVKKNFLRRPTDIRADVLTVIPAEEVEQLRPAEISDKVYRIMADALPERYKPLPQETPEQSV